MISHGGVPGGWQSILRAEIFAAVSAVAYGLVMQRPFFVWTDNQLVYRRIKLWMISPDNIPCMSKDHDAWSTLCSLVCLAVQKGFLQNVLKVRSHEDVSAYPSLVEQWAIRGNHVADRLAEQARQVLPAAVKATWATHQRSYDEQKELIRHVQTFLLQVGTRAVEATKAMQPKDDVAWEDKLAQPRPHDEHELSFPVIEPLANLPTKHTLGPIAPRLHAWLVQLVDSTADPLWVTNAHLLIHFQASTRHLGFRYDQRRNKWDFLDDSNKAVNFDFAKAANWQGAALRCLARTLGMVFQSMCRLPSGHTYRCWTPCLLLRMPAAHFRQVQRLMEQRGVTGINSVRRCFAGWTPFVDANWA